MLNVPEPIFWQFMQKIPSFFYYIYISIQGPCLPSKTLSGVNSEPVVTTAPDLNVAENIEMEYLESDMPPSPLKEMVCVSTNIVLQEVNTITPGNVNQAVGLELISDIIC